MDMDGKDRQAICFQPLAVPSCSIPLDQWGEAPYGLVPMRAIQNQGPSVKAAI